MSERPTSMIAYLAVLMVVAAFMAFVLLSAVRAVHADVIHPSVDAGITSVGASESP